PPWLIAATRTFPIWGSVALLALTRVRAVGVGDLLLRRHPHVTLDLRPAGALRVSASAVVSLSDAMTSGQSVSYAALYVPALCPCGLVSAATLAVWAARTRAPL
ncbi:hypothetical protein BU14_0457s0003, partial [Porphyra umbilicalis]